MKTPQVKPLAGMTPLGLPETQHTPTPWKVSGGDNCLIETLGGEPLLESGLAPVWQDSEANAAFIVQACNAHTALVEALEFAIRIENERNWDYPEEPWLDQARQALALAKGDADDS